MGRTHEALERAEKEFQENLSETPDDSHKAVVVKRPGKFPMQTPSDRFQEVKTKLVTSFPLGSVKTILITSPAHGDGSTTTAVSFAKTMAHFCRLNVLLIDANLRSPRLHEVFNVEYNQGLGDLLTKEEEKENSLFKKVGHGNLYLITCGKKNSGPLAIFESGRFDKTLKQMREKFDYVILDAPPVSGYAETKVMGKKVDGVILVIESGKTRKQVAIKAKQELKDAGAKVLGVILNRRKYYIPEFIYKRL
ncbi:MAG: CpsD/CapB family tyrosine-protein kinase [Deltaproteobacteria bacterium]|nr:CpsD/CapB family tyrosine-protein kinase [Deltaproteobacteria bacterium]